MAAVVSQQSGDLLCDNRNTNLGWQRCREVKSRALNIVIVKYHRYFVVIDIDNVKRTTGIPKRNYSESLSISKIASP